MYLIDLIIEKIIFNPNNDNFDINDKSFIENEIEIEISNRDKLRAIHKKNKIINNNTKCVLYSHGNRVNLYGNNSKINFLKEMFPNTDFISYDYKGYGKSTGITTEEGIYQDILSIYLYLLLCGYNPKNIILHGYSLGCVPTLWLGNYLVKNNKILPKHIIIQAGFSSLLKFIECYITIKCLFNIIKCLLNPFLKYKFNNTYYIKSIGDKIPITLIHSKNDKLITLNHVDELKNSNANINVYYINGSHNKPLYSVESINRFKNIYS